VEVAVIELRSGPLSTETCINAARRSGAGGMVVFVGSVRDLSEGKQVDFLEYESYEPMALQKLNEVSAEAEARWPVLAIAIQHRVGRLEIGDDAVVVAVSCPHRTEAFEACRYVIDRLKEVVPIWKKEHGEGGQVWIGGPMLDETSSSPVSAPD
jgi:molybdopterin synthase catalytic subunit